jgi:hypothetical protein
MSLTAWLRRGALVLVVSAAGCGSTGGPSGADADAAGDAADASAPETSPDAGGDAPSEIGVDAASDGGSSDGPVEPVPVACEPGTACNERLDGQHLCSGTCIVLASGLSCAGEVRSGLCFGRPPATLPDEVSGGGFTLKVRSKPSEARVGDPLAIAFDVTNTTAEPAEARVGIKPGAAASLDDTGDFEPSQPLALAAGATRTITTHLHADSATILDAGNWSALDVTIAGTPLDPRGLRVAVPFTFAEGPRACGDRVYPDFVTVEGQNYGNARCCGGVFYPGAQCCTGADCAGGSGGAVCADGICVGAAPHINDSGSPLVGPQRVLIVLIDEPEPKPPAPRAALADVCADHAAERADVLGLPLIASWFADVARARVGRALTDFRFTVLAGLKTEDFAPANNQPTTYGEALEAYLVARGCTAGWGADFDRVIVMSPRIETGAHQGLVYAADRVAVKAWSASIATHELGHTFGATDRYWDVGGQLQYGGALMSTVDREPAELRDTVLWAEAGLGDVDDDGVIDALAFARAPERLELLDAAVEASTNNRSVSVRVRVGAREGGAAVVVVPREVRVDLGGVSTVLTIDGHRPGIAPGERDRYATSLRAGRDLPDAAFDALVAARRVNLRVRVDHRYTDAGFQRRAVALDETRELDVPVGPRL